MTNARKEYYKLLGSLNVDELRAELSQKTREFKRAQSRGFTHLAARIYFDIRQIQDAFHDLGLKEGGVYHESTRPI